MAWVIPVCWVAAIPPPGEEWHGLPRTHRALKEFSSTLKDFELTYKELPRSLAEVRAYARSKKIPCPTVDGFGQRFEFIRFGSNDFAIRSFGADGRQNTLDSDPDPSLVSWRTRPIEGMHYSYEQAVVPTTYAAPLIGGAASPSNPWTAEVFVDPNRGTRQLLVRNREKTNLFMVAPHDQVEEFLWMPNSFQIVFTAVASKRYRDGVYLWNLIDDSLLPVFDGTKDTSSFPLLSEKAS